MSKEKKEFYKKYCRLSITSELAADWTSIGCGDWEEDETYGHEPEEMFPLGYDQIPHALAKDADIRLHTVVKSITHGLDGCVVTTNDGTVFRGAQCVVTITVGCLRAGDIKFNPPLPADKIKGINELDMGVLNCLTLVFSEKWWPNHHLFSSIEYPDVNVYDVHHCNGLPILQLHRTGSESIRWEGLSDEKVAEEGMQIVNQVFKDMDVVPQPVQVAYSRWNSDPFSKGSYSFTRVGGNRNSYRLAGKPVGDALFFAGEHCSDTRSTTTHAALVTGRDAAKTILKVRAGKPAKERPTQPERNGKPSGKRQNSRRDSSSSSD